MITICESISFLFNCVFALCAYRQEERLKNSIGARVNVADKGAGVLSYFGFVEFTKNTKLCGVTLDEPVVSI